MRFVRQVEYRGHTLLLFQARTHDRGKLPDQHWLVVAPDGLNLVGTPKLTEEEARAFVDSLLDAPPEK